MEDEDVVGRAARLGEDVLGPGLRALAEKHDRIGEVRGTGAFWALELVSDRATREPLAPYGGSSPAMGGDRQGLPGARHAAVRQLQPDPRRAAAARPPTTRPARAWRSWTPRSTRPPDLACRPTARPTSATPPTRGSCSARSRQRAVGLLARGRRRRHDVRRAHRVHAHRPDDRRRRLPRALDGGARQASRPRAPGGAARGAHHRLGGVGSQRRLLRGLAHPRRGQRPRPLARGVRRPGAARPRQPRRLRGRRARPRPGLRVGAHRHALGGRRGAPGRRGCATSHRASWTPQQVRAEIDSPLFLAGALEPDETALVHPARLALRARPGGGGPRRRDPRALGRHRAAAYVVRRRSRCTPTGPWSPPTTSSSPPTSSPRCCAATG